VWRIWACLAIIVAFGGELAAQDGPCRDLPSADSSLKVQIVEAHPECSVPFIVQLEGNPMKHLSAFYALIDSPKATDPLPYTKNCAWADFDLFRQFSKNYRWSCRGLRPPARAAPGVLTGPGTSFSL
jgi:hypothetical protein